MEKNIVIKSCHDCSPRCNASIHGWRNIYYEQNVYSITVEDDKKGFPDWCPLESS